MAEMIPPIAHFVWLGSDLPSEALMLIQRFWRLHPDWIVYVHLGVPEDTPDHLRALIDAARLPEQKKDLLSYWLLHRDGGVFLDVDTWTLRPFDDLLDEPWLTYQTGPDGKPWLLASGYMADEPGGEWTGLMLDTLWHRQPAEPARAHFGPRLLSSLFLPDDQGRTHSGLTPRLLPPWTFTPLCWTERDAAHALVGLNAGEAYAHLREMGAIGDDERPYAIHLSGLHPAPAFLGA